MGFEKMGFSLGMRNSGLGMLNESMCVVVDPLLESRILNIYYHLFIKKSLEKIEI